MDHGTAFDIAGKGIAREASLVLQAQRAAGPRSRLELMTPLDDRRRTADRIFQGALMFNAALTAYWIFVEATHGHSMFFQHSAIHSGTIARVGWGILFFYVDLGLHLVRVKTRC